MKVYTGSAWAAVAPTATSVTWSQISDAPSFTSQSGKYLKSNGSALVWEVVADEIPSQTGQAGKYLKTDGSVLAWDVVADEIPSQSGQSGKYLSTNGSTLSWATVQAGFEESKAYFFASF